MSDQNSEMTKIACKHGNMFGFFYFLTPQQHIYFTITIYIYLLIIIIMLIPCFSGSPHWISAYWFGRILHCHFQMHTKEQTADVSIGVFLFMN